MTDPDTMIEIMAEHSEAIDQLRQDVDELYDIMPDIGEGVARTGADAWTDFLTMLMYAPNLVLVLALLAVISIWGLVTYFVQQWISHKFRD